MPDLFDLADKIQAYVPIAQTVRRYEFVTFHQSYSYEDFVEGIKPVLGGEADEAQAVGYEVVDGIFKRMASRAMEDPGHRYALFIDEINRGNIANIFGELITLIEDDKRMQWDPTARKWAGDIRVKLPYPTLDVLLLLLLRLPFDWCYVLLFREGGIIQRRRDVL